MKKLSKIAQVTFFAAAFAVLFSGTADAYIDPSVMNYAIQAVAGVVIAVGAAAGIYWRKAKKKIDKGEPEVWDALEDISRTAPSCSTVRRRCSASAFRPLSRCWSRAAP